MRKLIVFNQVTVDGYFADVNGDMSWAHNNKADAEWKDFVEGNAKSGGQLVFGRKTYEMMSSYWPTAAAQQNDPVVAERMNNLPKVVFSRTLDHAGWNNTRVVKTDMATEIRRLKAESGAHLAVFGSGTVVSQLADAGLIDEYQLVVSPLVLGKGRSMFADIHSPLTLKPNATRTFTNGCVLMCYAPA